MEKQVVKEYAALGFVWTGTGGGCTALERTLRSGSYLLITVEDDADAPTRADQSVVVGLYFNELGSEPSDFFHAPSAKAAIREILKRGWINDSINAVARTEGPWRVRPASPSEEFGKVTVVGKRGAHVAEVWNGGTRKPEVAQANAQLICAAEDLEAALLAIVACVDRPGGSIRTITADAISKARAALAKAGS